MLPFFTIFSAEQFIKGSQLIYYGDHRNTFAEAKNACASENATLVEIWDEEIQRAIDEGLSEQLINNSANCKTSKWSMGYWAGGIKNPAAGDEWRWSTSNITICTSTEDKCETYRNWYKNQSKINDPTLMYAVQLMQVESICPEGKNFTDVLGSWISTKATSRRPYICFKRE